MPYAALLFLGAVIHVTDPGPQYLFGAAAVYPGLRAAIHGPIRSGVSDCSTPDTHCVQASFVTLAAPRRCGEIAKRRRFAASGVRFRRLGQITAVREGVGRPVWLVTRDGADDFVLGYSDAGGIEFVMLDARPAPDVARRMRAAARARRLQQVFAGMQPPGWADRDLPPVMPCTPG